MKRVLSFLLIVFLLIPCFVDAKEVSFDAKIYGNGEWDHFKSIVETKDGYYVPGRFYFATIEDVPYIGGDDIRVFFYGKDSLDIKSQFIYGGSYGEDISDMIQGDSNELVVVGNSGSADIEGLSNNGYQDALIVKFNSNGEVIWQNNYGGSGHDYFTSIVKVTDGYVVAGSSWSDDIDGIESMGERDAFIVKYDNDGNLVWQKSYGGSDDDWFDSITKTLDGGYVVVGTVESSDIEGLDLSNNSTLVIVKYDKDGNLVWQKSYGSGGYEAFNSVIELDDGSLIVAGSANLSEYDGVASNGYNDAILLKYDKNGNLVWQKNYGYASTDIFYKVKKSSDGNLLTVGSACFEDEDIRDQGIIVKYDLSGNILEEYILGGNYIDGFYDVVETDSGYLVVGESNSTDISSIPFDGGYPSALIMDVKITYDLDKKTEEIKHGTYEVKQVGRRAEISLNPEGGYELDTIVVEDINGNQLSYYEENGKYYVDLVDDIVVDVKYKQKSIINPNTTGLFMILEVLGLVLILGYSIFKSIKRKQSA